MRINWKQLESKGFEVNVDDYGVDIRGKVAFTELAHVADALKERGISSLEAEMLVDEFFMKVEGRLILAAIE